MSEVRSGVRKRVGVFASALAFGAYLVLSAVPAQAAAADCTYNAVTKQVTFVMQGTAGAIGVGGGGTIVADDNTTFADGSQCGVATVNNTDGITIDMNASTGDIVLDLPKK